MTGKEQEGCGSANCTTCMFCKLVHKIITGKRRSKKDGRVWEEVKIGEADVVECHYRNPALAGFPEVNPDDFCGLHSDKITGVQTFGKYMVKS